MAPRTARDRLFDMTRNFRDDRRAYMQGCLKIQDKQGRTQPLILNKTQIELDRRADEQIARIGMVRMVTVKGRKMGSSTYINARGFHRATFGDPARSVDRTNSFIIAHRDDAADTLFRMIQLFQEGAPREFRHRRLVGNAKELVLANGSRYDVATAGSGEVGRSATIQFFHGSEVAHWPNASKIAAGAMQAIAHVPGSEIWLESTGNGRSGLFYEMARDARAGRGEYELIFAPWMWDTDLKTRPPATWEIPNGWNLYGRSLKLTEPQLYWAYLKNLELLRGNDVEAAASGTPEEPSGKFRQEYPGTLEDAFQSATGNRLIKGDLVAMARTAMVPVQAWAPIILGVDVARGTSEGHDSTTLIDRQGRHLGRHVRMKIRTQNTMEIAGHVIRARQEHGVRAAFIDLTGGLGAGVYDRLVELGHGSWVFGVQYAGKARNEQRFANKRAEIWWDLKEWIEDAAGCSIPDDDEIAAHIHSALWPKPNSAGQFQMEPKDIIRKREGFSPDWGDAAAQTFAEPVMSEEATATFAVPPPPPGW